MAVQVIHKAWISCTQGTCPTQLQVKQKGLSADASVTAAANLAVKVPLDGLIARVDAAGKVMQKLMYVKGKLQGVSTLYGAGGVEIHLPYHKGKLQGKAQFMIAGKKAAELAFHAGIRAGLSVMYDVEGRLAAKMHFMNDLQHGLHVAFHAATGAVLKAEMYVNGALQAKGELEGKLEAGVMLAGDAAFEAGLRVANSLVGKVAAKAKAGFHAAAEAEFQIGGGLAAAASAAMNDASQLAGLAAATLSVGAALAGAFGVNGGMYIESNPSATIMDFVPIHNIVPFCLCMSPSNPMVAAATAAAMGVLTPMPCIPNTLSPWVPGAAGVTINNNLALDHTSQLMCAWGGVIKIQDPGQTKLTIP